MIKVGGSTQTETIPFHEKATDAYITVYTVYICVKSDPDGELAEADRVCAGGRGGSE